MSAAVRLPMPEPGKFPDGFVTDQISYWRSAEDGHWYLYLPGGGLGNLANHEVTVHGDGTITVSPSVLVTNHTGSKRRHGFLKRGVWEPCGDDCAPRRVIP